MNHKTRLFKISDLFIIKYGVNLELCNCEECDKNDVDAVNFVSRTSMNNGVSGYVKRIDGIEPQSSGLITLAGGGSVLSTFLQTKPFYSGRDLYTLESITNISNECKLYIITLIKANRYRYAYGRQANKTFPNLEIELPIDNSNRIDWLYMEDYIKSLHHKPLTTKNKADNVSSFDVKNWKDFKIGNIFKTSTSPLSIKAELEKGTVPLISRSALNNGCDGYFDVSEEKISKGNCITIGAEGIFAFYQPNNFATGNKVYTLKNVNLNKYNALFITTILNKEAYKYSYGRARILSKLSNEIIKLPAITKEDGTHEPDWKYMENYIKSLPYGDRI